MIASHYSIPSPACIAFSGGRTSAFMLRHILDAHGGKLPPRVTPTFCNTGKERTETLDFVHEIEQRWEVPVVWLEYRRESGEHAFAIVNYETASRNGEPFDAVIRTRDGFSGIGPPNPRMRYCTAELKMRTMKRYMHSIGVRDYYEVIGLRADEPSRVARAKVCDGNSGGAILTPMASAGHDLKNVMDFWSAQPFDLGLMQHEGNCDLCFLKKKSKIVEILERKPELAEWWSEKEVETGKPFRIDRPNYRQISLAVLNQERFDFSKDEELMDCHCTD